MNFTTYFLLLTAYFNRKRYGARTFGLFFIIFICLAKPLCAQTAKGVSIGVTNTPPDESAMLDIISSNKGLLIPRMEHASMLKIAPVEDGLMVYVKDDNENKGFWYWSSLAKEWVQLKKEDTSIKEVKTPLQSIVMYCGSFTDKNGRALFDATGKGVDGTKMEGWHLCNGQPGIPDLRGRFVMGADPGASKDNAPGKGSESAKNHFVLTSDQMAKHNHTGKFSPGQASVSDHTHSITEKPHTHTIDYLSKEYNLLRRIFKRRSRKGLFVEMGKDNGRRKEHTSVETLTTRQDSPLKVTNSSRNVDAQIQYPSDFLKSNGGSDPIIDNVPSYFVVAFIIKIK